MMLQGLQVNGQPFFAPRRRLTLSATQCAAVLKLAWLVLDDAVDAHFIWLLSRLERSAAAASPWSWASQVRATKTPLTFRAWLASPVGYVSAPRGIESEFYLHIHLAQDDPAEDSLRAFCPPACHHDGLQPPAASGTPRDMATDALRAARRLQFARWLTTFD